MGEELRQERQEQQQGLGFRPLTPAPCVTRRTLDWLVRSAAAPGAGGRVTVLIPSQSRYTVPWNAPERLPVYHAQLDASVLGLTFEALVFVTMRYADRQTVAAFEEHVADIPNVLQAQRLFGDPDYLLRVVARDLPAYRQLYDERLATLPGVLRLSSTLVMKSVVDARPLPL